MKRLLVFVLVIIALLGAGCMEGTSQESRPDIDISGTYTRETTVGGDATWEFTVTNNGPGAINPLKIHLDYGGMDMKSLDPQPSSLPTSTYPQYGALQEGSTFVLKINLVATSPGVSDGWAAVDGYDTKVSFNTTVR